MSGLAPLEIQMERCETHESHLAEEPDFERRS